MRMACPVEGVHSLAIRSSEKQTPSRESMYQLPTNSHKSPRKDSLKHGRALLESRLVRGLMR